MSKEKFFILDGSSLLYRAFYALPLLESEEGVYTNAIVGFSNMLVKLLTTWQPAYLAIAFDKGKHTFRTDMYADYKGTRKPMPDELRSQVPLMHEMAEAWQIPLLELENYEADDIIGTLANKAVDMGMEAYIVTGDRDALQLVKKDLTVLYTKKGISDIVTYDEAAFEKEYEGLAPVQLIDLKGLMGDASDNIPGVPKVGIKTAIRLIAAYGTVEEVLLHVEEIAGTALKNRLRDNQEQALLSKKLATICLDVPVKFEHDKFILNPEAKSLMDFYAKYKIRSMFRHIKNVAKTDAGQPVEQAEEAVSAVMPEVKTLTTAAEGKALLKAAQKLGSVYIMPSFEGKAPHKTLKAMAVALQRISSDKTKSLELYYIQVSEAQSAGGMDDLFAAIDPQRQNPAWEAFAGILRDEKVKKYLHDCKDFYHCGMELTGEVFDLELIGYLLSPAASTYSPKDLVYRYGEDFPKPSEDCTEEQLFAWQALALAYASDNMLQRLTRLDMVNLYQDVEYPLAQVLAAMEQVGIVVNRARLSEQTISAGEKIRKLEAEIHQLAGVEFNVSSPKQLGAVLFEHLKLPTVKKIKTGYSTNVEVLNDLYNLHPVIEKILKYRQWTKLKSTYLDGIAPLIDAKDGRVHTSFNQTVTATGRLSSSDPNLQNIPVRSEEGKHIRELFEPGEGYDMLVSADYSQIELRVLADMSQDESFLKAFRDNEDIHARTAAEVFGVPISEITSDLRRKAKAVNFGIVYGISDYGLSQDLHIPRAEAKDYIEKYFAKCQGVKKFIDEIVAWAKKKGFVLTKYGRRRELSAIRSTNYNQRSLAERMAMNTPIQGTAADIIKIAMIRVYRALKEAGLKSRILLQVHDELVLEVVESELAQVKEILTEAMENAVKLSVPLTIDINTGKNWAQAK